MKFGWIPDIPDVRDLHIKSDSVKQFKLEEKALPEKYCIPFLPTVKDQGSLSSCTAHAAACMMGTFVKMANLNGYRDLSRLFIYKNSRRFSGLTGDSGSWLRDTMKSLAIFGSLPEEEMPYEADKFDNEPAAWQYQMASNFQALTYYRLDPVGKSKADILNSIKLNIAANRACMFGFTVYDNIEESNRTGLIPYPRNSSRVTGGHAVTCIGYDDKLKIGDFVGSFIIRNSWGKSWGDEGDGYLPYAYLLNGLAIDWWTVNSAEWVDLDIFSISGKSWIDS